MRAIQGKCKISIDDQTVIGESVYCILTDTNGTMTIAPELAGKLWLIENFEKKDLYLKLFAREGVFTGRFSITSSPGHPSKGFSTRINFILKEELKELEK